MRINASKIQAVIVAKKIPTAALFYQSGIERERLRRILAERERPRASEIHAIAAVLDVDPIEIAIGDTPPPTPSTPTSAQP